LPTNNNKLTLTENKVQKTS